MLSVKNLCFSYKSGVPIIKEISFSCKDGITLLIGENGSGKSTLMKLLVGALKPKSGEIQLNNHYAYCQQYKSQISYLPQTFDVYPYLYVQEILEFVAELKGIAKEKRKEEIDRVVDYTGIKDVLRTKLKRCSEGTIKRVGIASALLGRPSFIIMDEPTAGIDPYERASLFKTLRNCRKFSALLISSHIIDDISNLADNIIMLSKGNIVFCGSYSDFMSTLDGKIYSLNIANSSIDAIKQQYIILSEQDDGSLHVVPKVSEHGVGLKPVQASISVLWVYYDKYFKLS